VTKFAHQRFEPQGMTTNREIPFAKSLVDYIFRWMGMEFVEGYREENAAQPRSATTAIPAARVEPKDTAKVKEDRSWKDSEVEGETAPVAGSRITAGDEVTSGSSDMIDMVASEHADVVARETDAAVSTTPGTGTEQITMAATAGLNQSTAMLMGDAPACDGCGAITVRNGTCYKCMNCGNSMGCS